MRSFYVPKDTQGTNKKRARTSDADGADYAELRARGYEVKPAVMLGVSHWISRCGKPFLLIIRRADAQLLSHILTVYRPLDSNKELVAKELRDESHEFVILEPFNTIEPKSDHVISLLDSVHRQSRHSSTRYVLDRITYCVHCTQDGQRRRGLRCNLKTRSLESAWASSRASRVSTGSVSLAGISNPTTFDKEFSIDFDIHARVNDENEEVGDQCGTKHWIVPEKELMSHTVRSELTVVMRACSSAPT